MSTPLPTYSFLPWLRRGHRQHPHGRRRRPLRAHPGRHPRRPAANRRPGRRRRGAERDLRPGRRAVRPGRLIGVDGRVVVRTEPRNWITNFERTTCRRSTSTTRTSPGATRRPRPSGDHLRLRPWITLVVLTEQRVRGGAGHLRAARCPYITVPDASVLPPADDLWAWAHVHLNQSVAGAPDEIVSPDVPGVLGRRPDRCSARTADLGLLPAAVPAPAGRRHRLPRLRRADVRDGSAGRARPRPGRGAVRHRVGVGRLRRPARPAPSTRIYLPLVLPHRRRTATSSISCGC